MLYRLIIPIAGNVKRMTKNPNIALIPAMTCQEKRHKPRQFPSTPLEKLLTAAAPRGRTNVQSNTAPAPFRHPSASKDVSAHRSQPSTAKVPLLSCPASHYSAYHHQHHHQRATLPPCHRNTHWSHHHHPRLAPTPLSAGWEGCGRA